MVDSTDKKHGAHFTHNRGAELLIKMIPDIQGSVLEPTAGDGELIKALLIRAEKEGIPYSEKVTQITAIEIQERHYLVLKNRLDQLQK